MPVIEGHLDGRADLMSYAAWLFMQTVDWRNVNASEFRDELSEDEIDESLDDARQLMQELVDEFEAQGSPEDIHSVLPASSTAEPFQRFMQCVKEEKQDEYTWQMWIDSDTDLIIQGSEAEELGLPPEMVGKPVGYSDQLVKSCLLTNKALIQHTYGERPDAVSWRLSPIEQGGHTVYMGAAMIAEIDAVSKVPWIPPELQSREFAAKAKNGQLSSEDKWQRLVSKARLKEIRNFARSKNNFMFNPVLLYVNENHDSVHFDAGNNIFSVDFEFLKFKNGQYFDYISWPNEEDNRPIWIVDGQHRVRGFGGATRGSMLNLPFVIMIGDGSEADRELVARVFTEINTNAKSLDKMHQLYLKWEFGIPADSPRSDFSKESAGGPTEKSRPNRMAYDLALTLAAAPDSPLYNSIQFQEPDKSSAPRARMKRHLIVKSTNWMQIARKWFATNGIYASSDTDSYSSDEVMNFFIAFRETCNHDDWHDGVNRWKDARERMKKRSIIQQQGPFRALMDLVSFSVERLEVLFNSGEQRSEPFSVNQFMSILAPLKNIDWNLDSKDEQGLASLKGRGNLNVPHLKMWMKAAIQHGQVYEWEDVHNRNLKSLPGRGLNAPPSNENLIIVQEGDNPPWPGVLPLVFSLPKPEHTLRGWWEVTQTVNGNQETIDVDKAWVTNDETKTMLILESTAIKNNAEMIRISSGWKNGVGEALANEPVLLLAP